ncbi:sulfotransferase [Cognatishimia sp. SS12]|uniref:tetratricopeptide repeat-containing sulfotransferase family protein n=1 Tax=Cognatishimia sp. SS12 TaxID=2979465 RepID=UPI00232F42A5|nr:tetratricopeptide repeat-containing sulfotransferase family protein [Cognatishimia sp. SS12]MDC0738279.1 sulfotransferase [Cognatishimia sp. SS12]
MSNTTPAGSGSQRQKMTAAQAISAAQQAYQSGEWAACIYLCQRLLRALPSHALAHQLWGLAAYQQGERDVAVARLETALTHAPQDRQLMANMVEVLRNAGQLQRAIAVGEAAIATTAPSAGALSNLALAYYDASDLARAKALHQRALALVPDHIASLNNLGSIARNEMDLEGALAAYRAVLRTAPAHHESRNNLATVLLDHDRIAEAEAAVKTVLTMQPENAEALSILGRIALQRLDMDAAERCFRSAIAHAPNLVTAHLGLSQVLLEKNHPDLARAAAEAALDIEPDNGAALHQLGHIASLAGAPDEALGLYAQALLRDPSNAASHLGQGHLHLEHGEMAKARAAFERAAALQPQDSAPLLALARLSKRKGADDPLLQKLLAHLPGIEAMSLSKQIPLRFGLGDRLDAAGQHAAAWPHYAAGARLKRASLSYDAAARDQEVDEIIATFDAAFIERLRAFANPSAQPIFVLGMPRSGTTLTESILASHSGVHGAGELDDLRCAFEGTGGTTFQQRLPQMSGTAIAGAISTYVDRIAALGGGAAQVTDKMPANFDFIGVIHALLPNARIIHVARDGMDSCLSGFTRLFERSQLHSYDLVEMGRYYAGYRRLMRHWQRVLPQGAFHTVPYEALVTDHEAQARALLEYCGLAWQPGVLDSHRSTHRVRTASITQVREPVYARSVGKWQRYEAHLAPLKALVDAADAMQ